MRSCVAQSPSGEMEENRFERGTFRLKMVHHGSIRGQPCQQLRNIPEVRDADSELTIGEFGLFDIGQPAEFRHRRELCRRQVNRKKIGSGS